MRSGHFAGDLAQRCVAFSLMLKAVLQHHDGVRLTAPRAHKLGPWFQAKHGKPAGASASFSALRDSAASLRLAAGGRPPRAASCSWSAITRISKSRLSPLGGAEPISVCQCSLSSRAVL